MNTLNLKLCADFEHYESPVNYGIARSMGSAAYMVLSMLLGVWVTRFGVRVIPIAGLAVTALQGVSTGNSTLDLILRQKAEQCTARGLHLEAAVHMPEGHGLTSMELCVLWTTPWSRRQTRQ